MMENKTKIDLKNKSIFITGVAGFIGSNLAKRLLSTVEGVKVVGLDNMNHYYDVRLKEARLNELEQFENFSFVKGNLADKAVIESIFEQYKPEIVVNLGAQAGVRYAKQQKAFELYRNSFNNLTIITFDEFCSLVVLAEQPFAALISCTSNSGLSLAALYDGDFEVRTRNRHHPQTKRPPSKIALDERSGIVFGCTRRLGTECCALRS